MDFRQPITKALTTDILIAGGARTPVILNGTMLAISIFATSNIFLLICTLPIFIGFHIYIIFATKKDSKFFECFKNYSKYKEKYRA